MVSGAGAQVNKAFVVVALCALVASGDADADVHRCSDADGNIMYSQTPCDAQGSANVNDAQMQRDHSSEEGEFYRKELRELTQRLREC